MNIYIQTLTQLYGPAVMAAARAHALAEYPKESCGLIVGNRYQPCFNYAADPLQDFIIADEVYLAAAKTGRLKAVVHSHPDGPIFPNEKDMRSQMAVDVPFIVIAVNANAVQDIVAWGSDLPVAPVIGRPFVHGIFDCYSLIRDVFRLGKFKLERQGIGWPMQPVHLPEVPRDDNWWQAGGDLYQDYLSKTGFRLISRSEAKPGDGFLMNLCGRAEQNPLGRMNHAGLLVEGDLVLHHTPARLSRREPAGIWARAADMWVRHEANDR